MRPRIRILKCILHSRFGGPHRRSFAIARRLRKQGIETTFLFGLRDSRLHDEEGFECFYLRHLQFMTREHSVVNLLLFLCALPFNVRAIQRIIKSKAIDIVDVDGITNTVPALAARWSGRPISWCYNDHLPAWIERLMLPWVARAATQVIVQGASLHRSRTDAYPRLKAKTKVLYPGVDIAQFDPSRYDWTARNRWRKQWGIPDNCSFIGMIGNLNALKGHVYFLKAAAQIKRHIKSARFIVVGQSLTTDAGYGKHLEHLTKELNLEDDVTFTGFRTDIPAVLAALDIFVLASIKESCPNVVLEAMAMKVPVVTTDVGAVGELVRHGETALVVPAGDAEAIAEAVLAYLNMPEGRVRRMTEAARKTVEDGFGIDTIARRQLHVYQSIRRASAPGAADPCFGPRWEGERNKER